jgi:hypothetical protein
MTTPRNLHNPKCALQGFQPLKAGSLKCFPFYHYTICKRSAVIRVIRVICGKNPLVQSEKNLCVLGD